VSLGRPPKECAGIVFSNIGLMAKRPPLEIFPKTQTPAPKQRARPTDSPEMKRKGDQLAIALLRKAKDALGQDLPEMSP